MSPAGQWFPASCRCETMRPVKPERLTGMIVGVGFTSIVLVLWLVGSATMLALDLIRGRL
jgi:hypothetical protein